MKASSLPRPCCCLPRSGAEAQNFPTKSGTVIVPFAPGGPADITGRIVAEIFTRHLGQQSARG